LTNIDQIKESSQYILGRIQKVPNVAVILGSGLGMLAEELQNPLAIPYEEIPHFPISTVHGHIGQLVVGELNGKKILAMQGRFHYYEGYSLQSVTFPVRVMAALGIKTLIVTNAAGGVNTSFMPGDLMLIEDHLNFAFQNPLIGANDNSLGERFPDMSNAYGKDLQQLAHAVAATLGIDLKKGVYAWMSGPSYETPAEIRMLRILGVDAVGMSTVPEVVVAAHNGLGVLGISCISNMAAGILPQPLSHEEVMETANNVKDKFVTLVKGIIEKI
jgi:purine-nucleoside phosphorylase